MLYNVHTSFQGKGFPGRDSKHTGQRPNSTRRTRPGPLERLLCAERRSVATPALSGGTAPGGDGKRLKESLIGVEVYGRSPDYDSKVDSTVRSEVARLRARLSKYYSSEGALDVVVIDLPKGSYAPSFRQSEPTHSEPTGKEIEDRRPRRVWLKACLAGFGVAATATAGWWLS
jgi:hypothetical protein